MSTTVTATRIHPERGDQKHVRQCRRCGIDFRLNSRSVWENQQHCRDCRWYHKKES